MNKLIIPITLSLILFGCGEEETKKEENDKPTTEETMEENESTDYTIDKISLEAQYFLYMEDTIVMSNVAEKLGEFFPAVYQHGMSNGLEQTPPTAQAIGYNPTNPDAPFLLRAGMFSKDSIAPGENMKIEVFYSGDALMTKHIGPYEGVESAYAALHSEMIAKGLEPNGDPWEEYWNDPQEVGIENAETLVYYPVK